MNRKCLRTGVIHELGVWSDSALWEEGQAETVLLTAKVTWVLHRPAWASALKTDGRNGPGPNKTGKLGCPGDSRRRRNAHRWYPVFGGKDHTCQQNRSDVRRAGAVGRERSSSPGALRKSGFRGRPSLLPLPKFPLPASVVVAVGSGSKIHKPRPRLGGCQQVQGGTPEGSLSPSASAGPQDAPQRYEPPAAFRRKPTLPLVSWAAAARLRALGRPTLARGGSRLDPSGLRVRRRGVAEAGPAHKRSRWAWPRYRRKWNPPRGRRTARGGGESQGCRGGAGPAMETLANGAALHADPRGIGDATQRHRGQRAARGPADSAGAQGARRVKGGDLARGPRVGTSLGCARTCLHSAPQGRATWRPRPRSSPEAVSSDQVPAPAG